MSLKSVAKSSDVRRNISEAEWKARVDLAACHRLAAHYGWTDVIYNHATLRVPDEPRHFLIKPNDLLWEEITASNLVKLNLDGEVMGEDKNINVAGFIIHSAVLKARPDINCVFHVHTMVGNAFAAHGRGLRPISQNSLMFYNRVAYHDYEGLSDDPSECDRIAAAFGPTKNTMIMRNHGLITTSHAVGEAFMKMKYLLICCEAQMMLEASGAPILEPPPETCEHAAQQYERFAREGGIETEWRALLRMADRIDPSFRN